MYTLNKAILESDKKTRW